MGGRVMLPIRLYLYGEQAQPTAAREEPLWNEFLKTRLG